MAVVLSGLTLTDATGTIDINCNAPGTLYWARHTDGTTLSITDIINGVGSGFIENGSFAISTGANSDGITFATGNDGVQEISFAAIGVVGGGGVNSNVVTSGITIDTVIPVVDSATYTDPTRSLAAVVTEVNPTRFYWSLVTNPSTPTAPQIVAGTGGGILEAGDFAYTGTTVNTQFTVTNALGDEIHFVIADVAGNLSAVEVLTGVVVDDNAMTADDLSSLSSVASIRINGTETVNAISDEIGNDLLAEDDTVLLVEFSTFALLDEDGLRLQDEVNDDLITEDAA